VDKAEIAIGSFIIPRCEAPGVFQLVEAAFDHVAQGVNGGIDGQLDQAVSFGWDHCQAAAAFHVLANRVSVIAPFDFAQDRLVAKQHFGRRPVSVHDGEITFEVRDLTTGQGKRYGQAHCIDAKMDLGRKATF